MDGNRNWCLTPTINTAIGLIIGFGLLIVVFHFFGSALPLPYVGETYARLHGVPEDVVIGYDYNEDKCIVDSYIIGRDDALAGKPPCYTPYPECTGWGYVMGYQSVTGQEYMEIREALLECAE